METCEGIRKQTREVEPREKALEAIRFTPIRNTVGSRKSKEAVKESSSNDVEPEKVS
jgi:hypothetical protein